MSQSASSPSPKSPVKTRFLIISDTHNATLLPSTFHDHPFREPLPSADVLLHCGDLTMIGYMEEYESTLSMLESIDAPLKLVIAGNHDISLDGEYYARKGLQMHGLKVPDTTIVAAAKQLWTGERAVRAGVRYLEEGCYSFVLGNGARLRVCSRISFRLLPFVWEWRCLIEFLLLSRFTHRRINRHSAAGLFPTPGARTATIPPLSAHRTLKR
jgi:hypothetical protein